jgi:hypothetical protein
LAAHVLARALASYYDNRSTDLLDAYWRTALRRVWRAQHFSWWMTSMLHRFHEGTEFDLKRQLAELELVASSPRQPSFVQRAMRLARERHAKRVVDLKIRRMIKQLSARDPRIFVCSHSLEQNSRCRRWGRAQPFRL